MSGAYGQAAARPTGTPPMGWNPWNAFRTEVTEAKILAVAQALKQTGLAEAGYRFIDVDDGWWLQRNAQHRLIVRTSMFPSAVMPDGTTSLRPFVDRLHSMGLLAGLYTDIGRNACSQAWDPQSPNLPQGSVAEREIGSMDHQAQDMRLIFGAWNFDAIKVDACGLADFGPDKPAVKNGTYRALGPYIVRGQVSADQTAKVEALYASLKREIDTVRPQHDTALAICTWGEADVVRWGNRYGTSWRTSPDIEPTWKSMLANFDTAAAHPELAGPGHFNDPDMLELGNGEFDADHLDAARAHLSLWAMLNAPLILGSDITRWSPALVAVAGNREVIALDQDPLARQAVVVERNGDGEVLLKSLQDGSRAVALVNRGDAPLHLSLPTSKLGLHGSLVTRDLWTHKEQPAGAAISADLLPRQTLLLRVREASGGKRQR
ncbi:glycoside hydrolase family 27 protein [Terriglobus aquaticus]|uniref:Alpha-galactosidase n=2 Tax=Terriglobus aquaticus TaxID=940139 RepID=A0ABW9KPX6_9BACT|nr:glycoside hydrolase family 27 protein [Terriglobus aquaticus]